jgi:hypothetical protein
MAGRPRKPNSDELKEQFNPDAKAPSMRASTLGVDRSIANRIREISHETGASTIDITNRLLEYAMEHAKIQVAVKDLTLTPKELRRPRGS